MNPDQMRMLQQMQGGQPQQMPRPQQQGGGKSKPVTLFDKFGWWTVVLTILAGVVWSLVFLPPFK